MKRILLLLVLTFIAASPQFIYAAPDLKHITTEIISTQPYLSGNDVHITHTLNNSDEGDPVTIHFQIHDKDGIHLEEYDYIIENTIIEQDTSQFFDASFQMPIGEYVLNIAVTSPDLITDYLMVPDAASFEVVARSPVAEDPEIEIAKEVDTIRPVIKLIESAQVLVEYGDTFTDPFVEAVDDRDGDITDDVVTIGTIDTSKSGKQIISYFVEDAAGNGAIPVIRTVYVSNQPVKEVTVVKEETVPQIAVIDSLVPQDSLELENVVEGEVDGGFEIEAEFEPATLKVGDVGEIEIEVENKDAIAKDYVLYMFLEDEDKNFISNDNYFVDQSISASGEKEYAFTWLNNEKPGIYSMWAEIKNSDWSGDPENAGCTCLHKQMVGQITVEEGGPEETGNSLYRFWSESFRGHFFTTSLNEAEGLKNNPNWTYEGTLSQKTVNKSLLTDEQIRELDVKPVYRFWSAQFKHHFYTISETEKNTLIQNSSDWAYESVAYYAFAQRQMDTTAVHRFWSPSYKGHFFTTSETEKDSLIENDPNWVYEGIAWYMQK